MTPALLWSFTRQELVDRYAGSVLGIAWVFLQPIFTLFIFVVIFGQVMAARLPGLSSTYGYSIYLVAGMLPWLAFANTLSRTSSVFVDKKGILSKVGLSLPMLPIFIVLAECITFLVALSLFLVFLVLAGYPLKAEFLVLPWVFAVQQMLALGLGMIFAVLNVFIRDIREFIGILTQMWFWMTPIVWTPQIISPRLYEWLSVVNPMVPIINAYHSMYLPVGDPEYSKLIGIAVLAVAVLGFGYFFVKRMEKDVRDFL
ncbi:ABC transporter permease [Marinobacter sp.]|uniref:ABC transporter permease n=1 Tax=Marinobacter sp. TaxID=50741 RepID=UPI003A8D94C0